MIRTPVKSLPRRLNVNELIVSARIAPEDMAFLRMEAERTDRSMSALVRSIIEEWVDAQPTHAE